VLFFTFKERKTNRKQWRKFFFNTRIVIFVEGKSEGELILPLFLLGFYDERMNKQTIRNQHWVLPFDE